MSARLVLYSDPQSCDPSVTLISSVFTRNRSPTFTKRPLRTAPTPKLRPASCGSLLPLNRNAALRDITRRLGNCERLLMMLSVRPSERYSAPGSPLSLTNGSTATELIDGPVKYFE